MQLPRLKEWRLRRALTQRDLSLISGVGTSTINRIERGLQLARPSTVRRLATSLNVQPDDLMATLNPDNAFGRGPGPDRGGPGSPN